LEFSYSHIVPFKWEKQLSALAALGPSVLILLGVCSDSGPAESGGHHPYVPALSLSRSPSLSPAVFPLSLSLAHSVCLLAVHLLCQLANIFCGFIVRAWPGRVLVGPFESLAVLCVMQVQWDVILISKTNFDGTY